MKSRSVRDFLFPSAIAWKAYAIVIAASLIPTLLAVALGGRKFGHAEIRGYERELYSICRLLEVELASGYGSYSRLLEEGGSLGKPREEQIRVLHVELQPRLETLSQAYPEVQFGYYAKGLRAQVAMYPLADAGSIYRELPPEEFSIYRTGRPELLRPSGAEESQGKGGMAVQTYPLYNSGEIAGHVWAGMRVKVMGPGRLYTAGSLVALAIVTTAALLVSSWHIMRGLGQWEQNYAFRRGAAANREAAAIVHEMRNPIAVSKGLVQLILTQEADMRKRMWLSNIVRQLDHMNSIASDYLQYARPRQPQAADVSVQDIVGELLESVTPYVEESGVMLKASPACENLKARCDRDQVRQVLLNLVQNAVEAAPGEPGHRVNIRSRAEGRRVIIEVADNGPGIPEENLSRVFTPFFTSKPRGTGLGLAISKALIEQQGGSLTARSSPEGGAILTLELPRA
ncbi:MAG: HAMP domain-containing sensor histidine kinase [Firmicutes bacterium]|nr:HAMP domain-containing sensor histidine kinase [Bacillota bacterium]MDD4337490.1 HAMP domain-containing sensor histidine kinase [Bacillota bacterium]